MLQNFIEIHFEIGEKYLKFLQCPCVDTCERCPKPTFICVKCHKIRKVMRDYSADGYHYLPTSKMPSKMNDKEREIKIFYPRVQLKKRKLESKTDVQDFCDTFTVKKHLLPKYLNQLRNLKMK